MFLRKFYRLSFNVFILLAITINVCYPQFESRSKIKVIVENFIKSNVSVNSDERLDIESNESQLRLPVCPSEIIASFPKESNREHFSSIEISCNSERPWHAFVPVLLHIYTNVLSVKEPISSKQILREDDLDYVEADKNRLFSGYFKNKSEVIGLESTQFLNVGAVLTKRNLQQPTIIHRHDTIDIVAKKNQMTVSVKGIAQSDGRLGESIKAINPSTNRVIEGVVVASGKLEVL